MHFCDFLLCRICRNQRKLHKNMTQWTWICGFDHKAKHSIQH
jgi:hypothetical protein